MARLVFVDAMPFLRGISHGQVVKKLKSQDFSISGHTSLKYQTCQTSLPLGNLQVIRQWMGSGIQEIQPRLQDKKAQKNHNQINHCVTKKGYGGYAGMSIARRTRVRWTLPQKGWVEPTTIGGEWPPVIFRKQQRIASLLSDMSNNMEYHCFSLHSRNFSIFCFFFFNRPINIVI